VILVLVETDRDGEAAEVSLESLTFARSLSEAGGGGPVDAIVVGEVSEDLRAGLAAQGVRQIHRLAGEPFAAYAGAAWAAGLEEVLGATQGSVLAAAGTPRGMEVLAHVAARADVAMAANVVSVVGVEPLVVARQVMGGRALEEMRLADGPAVLTVAGHAVAPAPSATPGEARVVEHAPDVAAADLVARVVSTDEPEPDLSGGLRAARVVVGVGRGVGSADGFNDLLELTDLLHGALGASRVVTSLGWRPHHEQVGQTGSRIAPELYIPCGISGAIQHWSGCSSAQNILAINTDADAPMVTKATYAVIGDLHEVVPAVNAEIKRRRA
jgi:electron transfer flavoprotein alpha subunit